MHIFLSLFKSVRFHSALSTIIFIGLLLCWLGENRYFDSLLLLVFLAGTLGGVITTYLRLRNIKSYFSEIQAPSASDQLENILAIIQVHVSPIVAGVFGVIFYALCASGVIAGSLFPNFNNMEKEYTNLIEFFDCLKPLTKQDTAKALIWAFIAGFSERLVPNILDRLAKNNQEKGI
jgi:hypothetical protein